VLARVRHAPQSERVMAYVSRSPWRQKAAVVIAGVLARELEPMDRMRAFRAAYPFGVRKGWPYRVWLDQIARMTGRRPPLGCRRRLLWVDHRQLRMFSL